VVFGVMGPAGTRLRGVLAAGGILSNHIPGKGKGWERKKQDLRRKSMVENIHLKRQVIFED
jgi:hypothetical protein